MANASEVAKEVQRRLEDSPAAAAHWLESQGSAERVCERYDQAVRDLYWLDKGAKNLVKIGPLGIDYCLRAGLKDYAKTIAYNVAANSWPGWGDSGVTIARDEIEAGLSAAEINLSMAIELKKPADKISGAYWLLSALQLALGKFGASVESIEKSLNYAESFNDETLTAFTRGFKGIIELASGDNTGAANFDSAEQKLRSIASQNALGYVDQLKRARSIFVR